MDFASRPTGAGLAAIGVGAASVGVGFVLVRSFRAQRNPAARTGSRLPVSVRRRRASRPDGVRRRDAHHVRLMRRPTIEAKPEYSMPQLSERPKVIVRRPSGWRLRLASSLSWSLGGWFRRSRRRSMRAKKIAGDLGCTGGAAAADETEAAVVASDGAARPMLRGMPRKRSRRAPETPR